MFENIQINIPGGLDVPLPKMARVRQDFERHALDDVAAAVTEQVNRAAIAGTIKPGASIAVGVGSRGVANIGIAVTALIGALKAHGAKPFVFPAMGSHGGATPEGQTEVLNNYGITEDSIGAPIRASMETVIVDHLPDGTPLHVDKHAHGADGIVVINRVKPHTTFRGVIESGVTKMVVIGMGKINGATVMHSDHGMDRFPDVLPRAAEAIFAKVPFLFGVALIEDAYDDTAIVEALPVANLVKREMELLETAKAYMARLYFDPIDVLVVDQIGKNISGAGADPNVVGRNSRGVTGFGKPQIEKLVLLDLTEATHGNATGMGTADVITQRMFNRIDWGYTYANVITSAYLDGGLIPMVMQSELDAVSLAVKTVPRVKPADSRIVNIHNTLELGEINVSEALLEQVRDDPKMEIIGELREASSLWSAERKA